MIGWVSIVHHSRCRFSDYAYAVPMEVRKPPRDTRCNGGNALTSIASGKHTVLTKIGHDDDDDGDCGCDSGNHYSRCTYTSDNHR